MRLYTDFVYLLRDTFHRWPWWINVNGEIRSETPDGEEVCPLTAMLATEHHTLVDVGSYRIAAKLLGLDSETADAIAQAIDLREAYNAHVRADIIHALRLDEQWGRRGRWGDAAFDAGPWPHQYDRPLHRGSGSAGFARVAARRAPSRSIAPPVNAPTRYRLIVPTVPKEAALSISSGCGELPPAASSAFSVGMSLPGCALYSERCAAD